MSEKKPRLDLNASHPAIQQARADRERPLKLEQQRKELERLIKVYACLYALEHLQTENIEVRRDLEKLEAVVFVKRKSVDVEDSRSRVMDHKRQVWDEIGVLIDLVSRPGKGTSGNG